MKKNLTELVFVLDRSGSMFGLEADTVGGYNALLESNRALDGQAIVSTVLFNDRVQVLHDRVPIEEVPRMREADFVPSGCTVLLDAVGGALEHTQRVQRALPEGHRAEHVLVAIATDGLENASREYTYPQVKRIIGNARERGWEVVFMAANIDAGAEAERLGINRTRAVQYEATPAGTAQMYDTVCCASAALRTEGSLDSWSSKHDA